MTTKKILRIAFDVNGTLIGSETTEDSLAVQLLLKRLKKAGHTIIVWSGESSGYAKEKIFELGLENFVDEYASKVDEIEKPDIAFDDVWGILASIITIKV